MKIKSLQFSVFFVCILVGNISFSQTQEQLATFIKYKANVDEPLSKKEKSQIKEAYGNKAKENVFNNPQKLKDIKHLLRNRIEIYEITDVAKQKKCKPLSEVPLFDDFNKSIKRDTKFNIDRFNPLKYKLDFFSNGTYLYRINNTNYFIQITSQYRQ